MELEILGHWAGAPSGSGACSSYLVTDQQTRVLLDCGPGTLPLLQKKGITRQLDAIVLSHMHKDHILDIIPFTSVRLIQSLQENASNDWVKPKLYVPKEGGVTTLSLLNQVWTRKSNPETVAADPADAIYFSKNIFSDTFDIIEYEETDRLDIGSLTITFQRTFHSDPCFSPRVTNGESVVVYSADTGYIPEMGPHAQGADLFLCESTAVEPLSMRLQEHGHLTGELAGKMAAEAQVKHLVLTHLSANIEEHAANLQAAKKAFQGPLELASTERRYTF